MVLAVLAACGLAGGVVVTTSAAASAQAGATSPKSSASATSAASASTPHPVAPSVRRTSLTGVDAGAFASASPAFDPSALRAADAAVEAGRQPAAPAARATGGQRPAVFTAELATGRFTAAGVSWTAAGAPADVVVQVRIREASGWSDWQHLDVAGGPDPTSAEGRASAARTSTEPVSTGSADRIQVRIDTASGSAPRDISLVTVDPGSSAADAAPTAAPSLATRATKDGTPVPAVADAVAPPRIITRAQWGADESLLDINGPCPGYTSTIKVGFVHHTVGTNSYTAAQSAGIIRGIYAYHVQGNGWCDIGYNALVDRFGQIFEGRHGGLDKAVQGAHTLAFNTDSFGVAGLGTFSTVAAPAAMTSAMSAVIGWKLSLFARDPRATDVLVSAGGAGAKYPAGTAVRFNVVSGHRDGYATECPGAVLYSQLPGIRVAAADYIATHETGGIVVPTLIASGGTLVAPNGRIKLAMQTDGNLVLYSSGRATWSTRTFFPHSVLRVQTDGNMVVYGTADGVPVWSAGIRSPGAHLELQNDGNLVLYSSAHTALWDARGNLGRTGVALDPQRRVGSLASGASVLGYNELYRLTMQPDGNLVLYRADGTPQWWSGPRLPGSRLAAQADGNLVIYAPGGAPVWYSATMSPGAYPVLQNDGNLVVRSAAGVPLWDSKGTLGHQAVRLR